MKTATAKRTSYFSYPVEIVWRSIAADDKSETRVDPLSEEDFENTEPAPNTIYTRAVEIRQNELFAFRMKAAGFFADLRIELKPLSDCETKVIFTESMTYRTTTAWVFSRFGLSLRSELKALSRTMLTRIEDSMPKNKT